MYNQNWVKLKLPQPPTQMQCKFNSNWHLFNLI